MLRVALAALAVAGVTPAQFMHAWGAHFARGEYGSLYATLAPAQRSEVPKASFVKCFKAAEKLEKLLGADVRTFTVTRTVTLRSSTVVVPATSVKVRATLVTVYSTVKIRNGLSRAHVPAHLAPVSGSWTWMLDAASVRGMHAGSCMNAGLTFG
jgi:hypothetical protein